MPTPRSARESAPRLSITDRHARAAVPAPLLVLAAIASVQIGAAIAKDLFATAGPSGTVLLRLGFAALVLALVARPSPRLPDRRAGLTVLAFGLVLAAMNLSFYEAIARIPLGVAVTVEFLGPLGVAVAGSRRWLDGLWVVLAGAGVAMLAGAGGAVSVSGVAFALAAGAGWAAYILTSQRVGRAFPGASGLALALAVATMALLPFGVVGGGLTLLHPRVLAIGFAVAVLSSAVPYSLELTALRRLPASVFGVLMSLEPAMAALAGFVVLGESLRVRQLAAIGCVSVASAGATLARRPQNRADLSPEISPAVSGSPLPRRRRFPRR